VFLDPEQQTVVGVLRVVDAILVRDQGAEHGAELDHPMPVAVAARQARHLRHQHDPDLAEPDGGDQALEPCALMAARTRQPEIVIDDLHLRRGPSHVPRPLGELVLPPCTLLVLEDLALG
jgi:hypothetical protein